MFHLFPLQQNVQNGCEAIDVVAVASLIVAVVVLFPCLLLSFCFSGGGGGGEQSTFHGLYVHFAYFNFFRENR